MTRLGPVIATGALLALGPAARAQVTVNPGALDTLGKPQQAAPQHRPPPRRGQPPRPAAREAQKPAAPSTPAAAAKPAKPEKPAIPVAPPAIAAIPPPVAVPLAHPPPEPTIPLAPDAPGVASEIPNGLRVTFGPDRSDLNPATEQALRDLARTLKDKDTSINVYAYAAGSSEDPSTPRRLSLARALAARAVLMSEGIPSPRIYPRALGPQASSAGSDEDRDRVDVIAGNPSPPPGAPTTR